MALGDCSCNIKSEPSTPVAIMCDPSNLLGGLGGGTAGLDYELVVLANPADLTQPVVVVNNFNPLTGVYTPVYRNIDGTVYAGATPVIPTGSSTSFSSLVGCDVISHTAIWDTSGEAVLGNVLSFTVADDGATTENVSSVKVYLTTELDELLQVHSDVAAPFNFSVDTTSLANGQYKLYVEVTYPSGNTFIDLSHDITVTGGVPSVDVLYLPPGAHVLGGTRSYSEKINEAAMLFDSTGALSGVFALPLTAIPTPYVLVGTDFLLECPEPSKEKIEFNTSSSADESYVREVCMIDDTLSDGTVLVPFVRLRVLSVETGATLNQFDKTPDLTADYVVVGTESECSAVGTATVLVPRRTHLTGINTFTLPPTAQSATIKVRTAANIVNPPTFNDGTSVTPLFTGDVETWGAQDGKYFLLAGTFEINMTDVSDVITVIWTEVA